MRLSNSEVAATLGLDHSTVSRMRVGARIASIDTLQRIVREYHADPEALLSAAARGVEGDVKDWVELLEDLFDDGEPDLTEPDAENELVNH